MFALSREEGGSLARSLRQNKRCFFVARQCPVLGTVGGKSRRCSFAVAIFASSAQGLAQLVFPHCM